MKALIIENDLNWSLKLEMMLEELDFTLWTTCTSVASAKALLNDEHWPDLILCDVLLNDGTFIEIFEGIRIPITTKVILVTSSEQYEYYQKAQQIGKIGFLVKPFHILTLRSAIDLLKPELNLHALPEEGLSVRGNHRQLLKIAFEKIWWIEADGNYCFIITEQRKYALKISLRKIKQKLDERFLQVHKAFIINAFYLGRIELSKKTLHLKGHELPIGRKYQQELINVLEF